MARLVLLMSPEFEMLSQRCCSALRASTVSTTWLTHSAKPMIAPPASSMPFRVVYLKFKEKLEPI
jgi:hypothetical protein